MRLAALAFLISSFASTADADVCPACPNVLEPTLSEKFAASDAAVLAKYVSAHRGSADGSKPPETRLEILRIARDNGIGLKKGAKVTINFFVNSEAGALFFGTAKKPAKEDKVRSLKWDVPREISEVAYSYITQAPSPETPAPKRLKFFLKFFEFPETMIADDAYNEFAKAEFKDVKAISDTFRKTDVRKWLLDDKTPKTHIGLYGIMLGLCGSKEDLPLFEQKIRHTKDEFRMGIEGLIAGYLMITGDKGLDLIDRTKLLDTKAPVGEVFMAMQALRIMWTYGEDKVSRPRLKQSMRLMLGRRDYAELVLADLARWKDWVVMDRVARMYGEQKGPAARGFKIASIGYLRAATKDVPENGKPGPHVAKAKTHLDAIKKADPKMYRNALRVLL